MVVVSTSPTIVQTIMAQLSFTLGLTQEKSSFSDDDTTLKDAWCHQHLIGWHNFLCGYVPIIWRNAQDVWQCKHSTSKNRLAQILGEGHLDLYRGIWEDRNNYINGRTAQEHRLKETEKLHRKVKDLYFGPPTLDARYTAITAVPIHIWLKCNNKYVLEWVDRVTYQIHMTDALCACRQGQLTLQEAYTWSNTRLCNRRQ